MIVPELPPEIRELKERVGRFVEEEVVSARAADCRARFDRFRRGGGASRQGARGGARDAEHAARERRHRPLDARPGCDRGGVGQGDQRSRVRDRRPRPAGAARARHARAGRAVRRADRARGVAGSVGTDRAGRGLRPLRAGDHRRAGRRRLGVERREVVRHERGRPRASTSSPRSPTESSSSSSSSRKPPASGSYGRRASCTIPTWTTTPSSCSATAACPRRTAFPRAATPGRRNGSSSSGSSSPRAAAGRASRLLDLASEWAQEREAFGSPIADYQGVSFPLADSLTELHAARLLTYHAAHAFDVLADRKVVHGKVSMAKLFASETAGRIADRAVQVLGGRGYMRGEPGRAAFQRAAGRPDLGGHERDPAC